ncbi:hypothetical protein ACTFIV_005670 [Dictyostelium citrinum]
MIRGLYKSFSKSSLTISSFTNGKSKSFLNTVVSQTSRSYCNTTQEEKPKLRNLLKKFYLMIHPDTLTQHPHERNINSTNMKTFMGVIEQMRNPKYNYPSGVEKITFHVPEDKILGQEVPKSIGDRRFKIIDISFNINYSNPNAIPNQIRSLFEQCKLPTNFITEIEHYDLVNQTSIEGTVQDFILSNKHNVIRKLKDFKKEKHELEAMKRKIKKDLGVQVSLEEESRVSSLPFGENLQLLTHFENVYKQWKEKVVKEGKDGSELVSNGLIKFDISQDDINFIEPRLYCYLDRTSSENWSEYLNNLDLSVLKEDYLKVKKEDQDRDRELIKSKGEIFSRLSTIEKILRCRSIQPMENDDPTEDPNLYLGIPEQFSEYLAFTSMLIENKSKLENLMKTRFKKYKFSINIAIVANLHRHKYFIDIDGTLKINPKVTFEEFCDILESQHKNAFEKDKLSDKYESYRNYAQVRMGLTKLYIQSQFCYTHSHQLVFDAFKRLNDSADILRDLDLSGFSMVIGDYYGVSKEGDLIIKYDFNTQELIKQLSASTKNSYVDEQQQEQQQQQQQQQPQDIKIDLTNISSVLEHYENQNKSNNKTL